MTSISKPYIQLSSAEKIAQICADRYTHNDIDRILQAPEIERSNFRSDSKFLRICAEFEKYRDTDDPNLFLERLGHFIEIAMEVCPRGRETVDNKRDVVAPITDELLKNGINYSKPGTLTFTLNSQVHSEPLFKPFSNINFTTVYDEYNKALEDLSSDPNESTFHSCKMIECLLFIFHEHLNIPLPSDQSIKPLWKSAKAQLELDTVNQPDKDTHPLLGSISGIISGVGNLRTKYGAHGKTMLKYKLSPRHSRFVLNSAITFATFFVETWKEQLERQSVSDSK